MSNYIDPLFFFAPYLHTKPARRTTEPCRVGAAARPKQKAEVQTWPGHEPYQDVPKLVKSVLELHAPDYGTAGRPATEPAGRPAESTEPKRESPISSQIGGKGIQHLVPGLQN